MNKKAKGNAEIYNKKLIKEKLYDHLENYKSLTIEDYGDLLDECRLDYPYESGTRKGTSSKRDEESNDLTSIKRKQYEIGNQETHALDKQGEKRLLVVTKISSIT